MPSDFDIAIIGAGASGLAAARALHRAPVSTVILEARSRIGGRAHTALVGGHALDLGCGWLHSANVNPFAALADGLGFTIDKTPPHWTRQADNADFTAAEQTQFGKALEALEARAEEVAAKGVDRPVADLMEPQCPWNPLLDAFSAYYNGAEFDQISTLDYDAYDDSEINWRLPRGYGALIETFGAPVEVTLDTPVMRIDHGGERIGLETSQGVLTARAVIITVPTPLLTDDGLVFSPDLPDIRAAAIALPLGLANKVFLALDKPETFAAESHLFGDPSRTETGSYHLRPFGRPLIEAYLGGRHARALEAEGPGAGAAFAIEELVHLVGSSIRSRLTPVAGTMWGHDPWTRGSYSHAIPGGAWARAVLARPVDERLFFAGEAASPHAFSTAHGAALAGESAARLALQAMRIPLA